MSSVLCDWQIKKAIADGEVVISPFDESLVCPNSLDLRLGGNFSEVIATGDFIDPTDKSTFFNRLIDGNEYLLKPGGFVLASLLEDISLPDNICAEIRGKSSLGRLALQNSTGFAAWIDSGWNGILTIELTNSGAFPIKLKVGQKIGQMVFHRTEKAEKPYGIVGRYQKQSAGAGSKGVS